MSHQMAAGEAGATHNRVLWENRAGAPIPTLPTSSCRDLICYKDGPGADQVECSVPCPQLCFPVGQASQLSSRCPGKANPSLEESPLEELLGWRADVGKYCSLIPESPTPYLTALGGSRKDSTPWGHQSRCPSVWILGEVHRSAHHSMGLVFPPSHTRV